MTHIAKPRRPSVSLNRGAGKKVTPRGRITPSRPGISPIISKRGVQKRSKV